MPPAPAPPPPQALIQICDTPFGTVHVYDPCVVKLTDLDLLGTPETVCAVAGAAQSARAANTARMRLLIIDSELARPPRAAGRGLRSVEDRVTEGQTRALGLARRRGASTMVEAVAPAGKERLAGLDALRFAAAAMVMCFHLGWPPPHRILTRKIVHAGLDLPVAHPVLPVGFGWVGVQIFFVISGFVIAYSASRSTPWRFAKGRILRIAPALVVCSLMSAAVLAIYGVPIGHIADLLWRSWLLWPWGPWVDGVYWTLTIEVVFYAGVALLLAIGAFRHIEALTCLVGAAAAACDAVVGLGLVPALTLSTFPYLHHAVHFALGIMLWLIFFDRPSLRRWVFAAVFAAGGAFEIAAVARVSNQAAVAPVVVWGLAVIAIVLSAAFRRRIDRFAPQVRLAGLATYPLYLLHEDIGLVTLGALYAVCVRDLSAFLLVAAAMIGLSVLVARFAEPPMRRALGGLLDRAADKVVMGWKIVTGR